MRILVAPLNGRLGGTQINAVDLGATVRDLGHDVAVYVEDGPLSELISERGLPQLTARRAAARERGIAGARALWRTVRDQRIDLVHAYERARALQAYFGAWARGVPVIATVYSMAVPADLPDDLPIIVGTRELMEQARDRRGGSVTLLEPPVDTERDHPGVDGAAFRERVGIAGNELAVVVVSRLSEVLKVQGLVGAIDAAAELAGTLPLRLVIVGDGPARPQVEDRASAVNEAAGRAAVVLTGMMSDPRPAYAAADVMLGMGSSALRGMAFGKPTIVLGEHGFSEVFEPATAAGFLEVGMYGYGGDERFPQLASQLRRLLDDPALRAELGAYSRRVVEETFSLRSAGRVLDERYRSLAAARRATAATRLARAARAGARLLRGRIRGERRRDRAGRKPSEW